jgi:hypothetical protein
MVVLWLAGSTCRAQLATRSHVVEGYVATVEFSAIAPEGRHAPGSAESEALLSKLKSARQVTVRAQLAKAFSRLEILSKGFFLPPGTLVLHETGARFYVIANPVDKTFVVMDAEVLVAALEGSMGVVNSEYQARVHHSHEQKEVAGYGCHKAVFEITYASSIPFESDRILVAQKNEIEIWHTPSAIAADVLEHLLFKFRQDRTGQVQKVLAQDIGFPLEMRFVVTPASAGAGAAPQAGSFAMQVTDLKVVRDLDPGLFQIPPAAYRKLERNPYLDDAPATPGATK